MSDTSALSELAKFVGQSRFVTEDHAMRRSAINSMVRGLEPRPARKKVADLLGVVLTLSARTRRMVLPRAETEIDVFSPGGRRAVKLIIGH